MNFFDFVELVKDLKGALLILFKYYFNDKMIYIFLPDRIFAF